MLTNFLSSLLLLILSCPLTGYCGSLNKGPIEAYKQSAFHKKVEKALSYHFQFTGDDLAQKKVSLKMQPEKSTAKIEYKGQIEANAQVNIDNGNLVLQLKKQIDLQMYLAINHEENNSLGTHNKLSLNWDF